MVPDDEPKSEKDELKARAWDLHLNCLSQSKISDDIDVDQTTISDSLGKAASLLESLDPPDSRQHFDIWQFQTAEDGILGRVDELTQVKLLGFTELDLRDS